MATIKLVLWINNIRSCHNVGSLLRTADGLGVEQVVLSGYTPYPLLENDSRLPHERLKINNRISKTALGSERNVNIRHITHDISNELLLYRNQNYLLCSLEQTPEAIQLPDFVPPEKMVLLIGNELDGVDKKVLKISDTHIYIPMSGSKESFNVSIAAAMALYHCCFVK